MKTARVLIVDDDRPGAEILLRLLGSAGHHGRAVENAEDAASLLKKEDAYDLVLLDHVLPGATGMQSLGRLRSLTRAPIWIMSGYTDDDTRTDALLLGASGFLPKPIGAAALTAVIAALPERPGPR